MRKPSSVSASVAVEKNLVFGGEVVPGGYDVGGTQLQTVVASPSSS